MPRMSEASGTHLEIPAVSSGAMPPLGLIQ